MPEEKPDIEALEKRLIEKQRLKGDAALVETSMERFERLTGVILAAARSARRDA